MKKTAAKKTANKNGISKKTISFTIRSEKVLEHSLSLLSTPIQNEYEKKMDEKANEMATYFDERITVSGLAKWVSKTNEYCHSFNNKGDAIFFINKIGWLIVPALIDCKNKEERIQVLKKQLIWIFNDDNYDVLKDSLAEIGISFLKAFVEYEDEKEEISEFMNIYKPLLCLMDMFQDYCIYREDFEKEKKAA